MFGSDDEGTVGSTLQSKGYSANCLLWLCWGVIGYSTNCLLWLCWGVIALLRNEIQTPECYGNKSEDDTVSYVSVTKVLSPRINDHGNLTNILWTLRWQMPADCLLSSSEVQLLEPEPGQVLLLAARRARCPRETGLWCAVLFAKGGRAEVLLLALAGTNDKNPHME